ncbi:MAG: ion channel [Fulvivirga sp.]|uniref:ion channel n=1 Tax=Fulvivirga sp. TaxID=1931237 RepID=UPI0032EDF66F
MSAIRTILAKRKYEILLITLILHLYIGIVLTDLVFYDQVIWPLNMILIGVASIGVFTEQGKWKIWIKNTLLILVILFPLLLPFLSNQPNFLIWLSATYCAFFAFIFYEIIKFLIRPGYINVDIISASACGYFLLIEICVFLMQALYYLDPSSISVIDSTDPATIYMDLVYFSSITITTIGFGDISPVSYSSKLIVSLFGVASQFYSVVLVGILISKFSNRSTR